MREIHIKILVLFKPARLAALPSTISHRLRSCESFRESGFCGSVADAECNRSLVVEAHVSGFIGGKNEALSLTDAALRDLFAIDGEFRDTPFAHTTVIILEIERDRRLALGHDGWTFNDETFKTQPFVLVRWFAVADVQ